MRLRTGFWLVLLACPALAQEKPIKFVRDIRPLLAKNCFSCHGPDEAHRKAGLRLDTEEAAKAERRGRRAVVPNDLDKSTLIQRIVSRDDDQMPPADSGKTLTPEQIDLLKQWVKQGAKWGQHWAFEKPAPTPLPALKAKDWAKNGIDHFIGVRLEKEGFAPTPEADKHTLARRVSLDLTGLPPAPELLQSFLKDESAEAYEKYVDALLRSPAYGERFARLWLDLARYADTKGYEKDLARVIWRYRDWVIDAFNRDLPYDQFTREQLAGDLLPNPTPEQLLATAFHRNTMVNDEGGTDDEEFRVAAVKDRVDTTLQVWMGLTVGCAKCHSHKYDPIALKEYYQLYAFFNQTQDADTADESPKVATPTKEQKAQQDKLAADIFNVQRDLYNFTDDFKALQTKWEEQARNSKGWQATAPKDMNAISGSTMKLLDDKSVLVEARKPMRDTYTVTLPLGESKVTGVRLEVLPDKSLPRGGVGRAENDGNFVLSRILIKAKAKDGTTKELPIASATADFSQQHYPIEHAIKNPDTRKHGWAVSPQQTNIHWAAFTLAEPYTPAEGTELEVTLDHQFEYTYPGFSIGRFRLFLTDSDSPAETELAPEVRALLNMPVDKRTAEQQQWMLAFYANRAPHLKHLRDQVAALQQQWLAVPVVQTPVLLELTADKRRANRVHQRGNFLDQGEVVEPGVPAIFHAFPPTAAKNRLGLAEWLVHPDNPLTARVAVNRLWANFFGRGLVETAEDFGSQGQPPTHPELLDWLALRFRSQGWSMKALCKTIVLSATYRQASKPTADVLKRDPRNALYARGPRFRLEAEMIRDATLAASGLLSSKMHGPSVMPPQPDGLWKSAYSGEKWVNAVGEDRYRRGLYTFIKRTTPYPALTTLDAPSREICTVRRITTNTPLQALVTLNDTAFIEMAQSLARKMLAEGNTLDEQLRVGLQRALLRPARDAEVAVLKELYGSRKKHYDEHPDDATKFASDPQRPLPENANASELAALTAIANVILNLDEFLTRN